MNENEEEMLLREEKRLFLAVVNAGFDSILEFHMLVSRADISTPEKLARFESWKLLDGSKAGLLALCGDDFGSEQRQFMILSYGAGTNSTAILAGMKERGERPDAITFSNTGDEKPHTYKHIEVVNAWCKEIGFPEIEILGPVMPQQIIDRTLEHECLRLGKLPAKAYGFSSCSDKWKMEPQRRYNRAFAERHGIELSQITRLIGFDADEHSRVQRGLAMAHKKPVKERYPLYEWGWGREECVEAIARAGLPQPGKSACFYCPSSKKPEILELRDQYPDLFARAVVMERRARAGEGPAPATTSPGLGRYFSWEEFVQQADEANAREADFCSRQFDLFSSAGIPEMDCGCFDGD